MSLLLRVVTCIAILRGLMAFFSPAWDGIADTEQLRMNQVLKD